MHDIRATFKQSTKFAINEIYFLLNSLAC